MHWGRLSKPAVGVQIVDFAEGCEHRPQFKGDELRADLTELGIRVDDSVGRLIDQPVGLEDDRGAAEVLDRVDLAAIGVHIPRRAGRVGDVGSGDESALPQDRPRPLQDGSAGVIVEQVDVAGIHVDGRR